MYPDRNALCLVRLFHTRFVLTRLLLLSFNSSTSRKPLTKSILIVASQITPTLCAILSIVTSKNLIADKAHSCIPFRKKKMARINYWNTHKPVCFVLSYVLSATQWYLSKEQHEKHPWNLSSHYTENMEKFTRETCASYLNMWKSS